MTNALTLESQDVHTLDVVTSQQVLQEAVAARSELRLLVSDEGVETAVVATLAGGDSLTLILDVRDPDFATERLLPSSMLHATLEKRDVSYVFESALLSAPTGDDPRRLRLRRPNTLITLDRRRSVRTPLRDPTPVTIHAAGPGDPWQCAGDILNLSLEGLACRVRESDATLLTQACKLRTVFRIGRQPQAFDVACRITNVTQGATPQCVVLGVAFLEDNQFPATRAKLKSALTRPI